MIILIWSRSEYNICTKGTRLMIKVKVHVFFNWRTVVTASSSQRRTDSDTQQVRVFCWVNLFSFQFKLCFHYLFISSHVSLHIVEQKQTHHTQLIKAASVLAAVLPTMSYSVWLVYICFLSWLFPYVFYPFTFILHAVSYFVYVIFSGNVVALLRKYIND